jgi:hypothetical protein
MHRLEKMRVLVWMVITVQGWFAPPSNSGVVHDYTVPRR